MRTVNFRKLAYVPMAALILSGFPMLAEQPSSVEASRLLTEVKSISYSLNRDAGILESYKRTGVGWQSHAFRLMQTRRHVNAIGERLERLQAMKASAEPWQQQAIEALMPVAAQLASNTEGAIVYLNANQSRLAGRVYTDRLSAIAQHADRIQESVNLHLDLAGTQQKLDGLTEKAASLQS